MTVIKYYFVCRDLESFELLTLKWNDFADGIAFHVKDISKDEKVC